MVDDRKSESRFHVEAVDDEIIVSLTDWHYSVT